MKKQNKKNRISIIHNDLFKHTERDGEICILNLALKEPSSLISSLIVNDSHHNKTHRFPSRPIINITSDACSNYLHNIKIVPIQFSEQSWKPNIGTQLD